MRERLIAILVNILDTFLKTISPEIKKLLVEFIKELDIKAKATENPVDDFFVTFLAFLFEIEI